MTASSENPRPEPAAPPSRSTPGPPGSQAPASPPNTPNNTPGPGGPDSRRLAALQQRGYTDFVRIDSGGQANVYRTSKGDRAFAIKVVPVDDRTSNECGKLDDDLRRELTIVHSLRHPNCIRVNDIFRTRTRVYIVMPFMPNGTVGNVIRKHGALCEWNCKVWWSAIARAIKYLHENRIAHRDLKLDNVLLDGAFNPIVTDFGFSRFVSLTAFGQPQKSDTFCGTTSYNAPEILKRQPYDPFKIDIWCLGVMLFVMLNKHYPFDRKQGPERMIARQYTREYRFEKPESISAEAKDLIRILLEPVIELRPSIRQVCEHHWVPVIYREADPDFLAYTSSTPPSDAAGIAARSTSMPHTLLSEPPSLAAAPIPVMSPSMAPVIAPAITPGSTGTPSSNNVNVNINNNNQNTTNSNGMGQNLKSFK